MAFSSQNSSQPLDNNVDGLFVSQIKYHNADTEQAAEMEAAMEQSPSSTISCMAFDNSGAFLATGDIGGRIMIYQEGDRTPSSSTPSYDFYCRFSSHEREFDCLKSVEIEEKINKVKWLSQTNRAKFLLTTNDKTIKLWRIKERSKRPIGFNIPPDHLNGNGGSSGDHSSESDQSPDPEQPRFRTRADLRVPHYENVCPSIEAYPRRIFAFAHAYLINSLSVNSDQETFLSADDLRINLWNLQVTDCSFTIVDIKPKLMEDLIEVITAAEFHPSACALFAYSSSRGTIRLCDMRERALCDNHALLFEQSDESNGGYFSELVSSVTDLSFSHSGRYIASRDYLTVKIWDTHMPRTPMVSYSVHDFLRPKLCNLYESDLIFDKFECQWSPDDRFIATGSYNKQFRVFDRLSTGGNLPSASESEIDPLLELYDSPSMTPLRQRRVYNTEPIQPSTSGDDDRMSVEALDMRAKLLHLAWHPKDQWRLALTSQNRLFFTNALSRRDTSGTERRPSDSAMDVDTPPLRQASPHVSPYNAVASPS